MDADSMGRHLKHYRDVSTSGVTVIKQEIRMTRRSRPGAVIPVPGKINMSDLFTKEMDFQVVAGQNSLHRRLT